MGSELKFVLNFYVEKFFLQKLTVKIRLFGKIT